MITSAVNIVCAATSRRAMAAALCLGVLGLTGCHRAPPGENCKECRRGEAFPEG